MDEIRKRVEATARELVRIHDDMFHAEYDPFHRGYYAAQINTACQILFHLVKDT